jgi:SHS2 domain-containing protein
MKPLSGQYDFLPHTADAKFRAYGRDLSGVFRNAARAMFAIMTDIEVIKPKLRFEIRLAARSEQAALFDFLDRLIFLLDTEGFLLKDAEVHVAREKVEGNEKFVITGAIIGDYHKGYEVSGSVKAVTYSDMSIEKTGKGLVATVVVDI